LTKIVFVDVVMRRVEEVVAAEVAVGDVDVAAIDASSGVSD